MQTKEPKKYSDLTIALTVIWTILGAAAPAPLVPFGFIPQIGWVGAIIGAVIATVLWLAPGYFVIIKGR